MKYLEDDHLDDLTAKNAEIIALKKQADMVPKLKEELCDIGGDLFLEEEDNKRLEKEKEQHLQIIEQQSIKITDLMKINKYLTNIKDMYLKKPNPNISKEDTDTDDDLLEVSYFQKD